MGDLGKNDSSNYFARLHFQSNMPKESTYQV